MEDELEAALAAFNHICRSSNLGSFGTDLAVAVSVRQADRPERALNFAPGSSPVSVASMR